MNAVFADTYYFVALVNLKGGKARLRAVDATLHRAATLITTTAVLTELANTLSEPRHRQIFLDILSALRSDPTTRIIEDEPGLFQQGVEFFVARPDKGWSLTDCISFIVMTREGISDALTATITSSKPASARCLMNRRADDPVCTPRGFLKASSISNRR